MRIHVRALALHEAQQRLYEAPGRFKIARCGRRWGKTLLGAYWVGWAPGSALSGALTAWFAPTYKYLVDPWAIWVRELGPLIRRVDSVGRRIELVTGGVIEAWSLEDPSAGRSRRYHRVVIDEAAHVPTLAEAWPSAIRPTLTDFRGEAWFLSTPRGQNYFYHLAHRATAPDWAVFHFPSATNPYLSAEELARAKAELPHLIYLQEYEAEFVTLGAGLVRPEYLVEAPYPVGLPCAIGVDLAISTRETADYSAIAVVGRDADTGMIYLREIDRGRWTFAETFGRIEAMAARHHPTAIAVEAVQYQAAMVQELVRRTPWRIVPASAARDKVTRFGPLLTRYEQRLVRHDPVGVPPAYRDELLAFPEGAHDDMVDAVVHAVSVLLAPRTPQIMRL